MPFLPPMCSHSMRSSSRPITRTTGFAALAGRYSRGRPALVEEPTETVDVEGGGARVDRSHPGWASAPRRTSRGDEQTVPLTHDLCITLATTGGDESVP